MVEFTRRRALLLSLTLPLGAILTGCDANPNGPTFPTVPAEKDDDEAAAGSGDAPAGKGRRKKKSPMGMIGDPAA